MSNFLPPPSRFIIRQQFDTVIACQNEKLNALAPTMEFARCYVWVWCGIGCCVNFAVVLVACWYSNGRCYQVAASVTWVKCRVGIAQRYPPYIIYINPGYACLLAGTDAYSYIYQGQAGYLDHALASASLSAKVTGITEWHIKVDEPEIIDYKEK